MKKKLVAKIKAGTHALEFDNGNLKQLNDVEYLMDGERFLSGVKRFYVSLGNVFGGVDKTKLPTIKLSKIFKPKKVKKPNLEYRVSRLEKALEIENSLFKAVADDFDKPFTKADAIEIPDSPVSKDLEKRDEVVKECEYVVCYLRKGDNKTLDTSSFRSNADYVIKKYKGIDKPVVEEL